MYGEALDTSSFSNVIFSCNVQAGMSSYWSELASLSTLDSLLKGGLITLEQYLERIPDGYISKREELLEDCRRVALMTQMKEGMTGDGQRSV